MNPHLSVVPDIVIHPISPNTLEGVMPLAQIFQDPAVVAHWYKMWCEIRKKHPKADAMYVDHATLTCNAMITGFPDLDHATYFYLFLTRRDIRVCWLQIPIPYLFAN
jgi:hypothetical protein